MSKALTIPNIIPPTNATAEMLALVAQINRRLRDIEKEFNKLTQDVYVKNNTKPYFLPTVGASTGYKLVYTTRLDEAGNILPSAEWIP
jgi:dihydroorotase